MMETKKPEEWQPRTGISRKEVDERMQESARENEAYKEAAARTLDTQFNTRPIERKPEP